MCPYGTICAAYAAFGWPHPSREPPLLTFVRNGEPLNTPPNPLFPSRHSVNEGAHIVGASGGKGFPENEVRVFGGSRCGGRRRARLTGTPITPQKKPPIFRGVVGFGAVRGDRGSPKTRNEFLGVHGRGAPNVRCAHTIRREATPYLFTLHSKGVAPSPANGS